MHDTVMNHPLASDDAVGQVEALKSLGLSPLLMNRAAALAAEFEDPAAKADLAHVADTGPPVLLRVAEVQREGLTLHDGHAAHAARLLPALRHHLADSDDAIAVGDWVLARRNRLHEWWVAARVPPATQLARRLHDGRDKVTRTVIASNVDTALLVMGLDQDFNLRRLERYIALVRMAGVTPLVVLSKADTCAMARVHACVAGVQALLPADGAVLALNVLSTAPGESPRDRLAPWLDAGETLVLLGSSGAGKSTLSNALTGTEAQRTGANRDGDNRGRHTTTARSLHRVPGGACLIDTPGLRTLRLDGDEAALGAVFDDIAQLAPKCRFRDCQHQAEPGCAVRETVPAARLGSWQKLQREARRDAMTALDRKAQQSQWKVRSKASRQRMADKRS